MKKPGRKQPLSYVAQRADGASPWLLVPGHYEVACGGCDTLEGYEEIYQLVRDGHRMGFDVLYEGLLASGESARPIALAGEEGVRLEVVRLTTDIDTCLQSINDRRRAKRGPDAPEVKPRNTIAKARAVDIAVGKMRDAGIPVHDCDRDSALVKIRELLNI